MAPQRRSVKDKPDDSLLLHHSRGIPNEQVGAFHGVEESIACPGLPCADGRAMTIRIRVVTRHRKARQCVDSTSAYSLGPRPCSSRSPPGDRSAPRRQLPLHLLPPRPVVPHPAQRCRHRPAHRRSAPLRLPHRTGRRCSSGHCAPCGWFGSSMELVWSPGLPRP